MASFEELRRRMTPPTETEVADAIIEGIAGIAVEHAEPGTVAQFGVTQAAAKRLTRRVCAHLHSGSKYIVNDRTLGDSLGDLIRAYDVGCDLMARQAFHAVADYRIDEAAADLVAAAEEIAEYWLAHKKGEDE